MRGLIKFIAFLLIVFFVVGEFLGGWYLGVIPSSPIFVYKKDRVVEYRMDSLQTGEIPVRVEGTVRRGKFTIEGTYERPPSFQSPSQSVIPETIVFREEFREGERVRLSELMSRGPGTYRLRLIFEDATGLFRVEVPPQRNL